MTNEEKARDEFAGRAMQAMLPFHQMRLVQMRMSLPRTDETGNDEIMASTASASMTGGDFNYDELATESYLLADAMMRARERGPVMVPAE